MKNLNADRMSSNGYVILLTVIIFFCPFTVVYAWNESTKIWTTAVFSGIATTNKKIKFFIEPQLFLQDDKYKFNFAFFNGALGYQTSSRVTLWFGATRVYERQTSGELVQEYRLWQQVKWRVINLYRYRLVSRTLLEERQRASQPQHATRLRQRLKLHFPFPSINTLSLVLSDELFFNLNQPQWVVDRCFAENRAAISLAFAINKKTTLSVGYLNQFLYQPQREMAHVLNIELFYQLN